MPSFDVSPAASRDADARRRWVSAALRSAALLIVPLACWLLVPAPSHAPEAPPARAFHARVTPPPVIAPPRTPTARPPLAPPSVKSAPPVEEGVGGEVQDPQGEPVAGATVTCSLGERELTAEADGSGAFKLDAEAAGCRAVATKDGFGPSQPEVLRAGSGNRLRLSPPTGIAGNVVDEQGQPVMSYWIGVDAFRPAAGREADGGGIETHKRQVDDAEGAFAFTDLAPGHYELGVGVRLGPMARSAGIDVAPGAMTRGVRIVVHPGVTVTGTVVDAATHAPIDGAKAFVVWGGLSTRQPFTRGGKFTLENAPSGRFDLRVFAPGYALKIVPGLEGRPGGRPLHVDVALDRSAEP